MAALALVIAATGVTPAEAARAIKKAVNADKVNGIAASKVPAPGKLLPLGADGKFPKSVLPLVAGPRGPRGPEGPAGPAGSSAAAHRTVFRAHAVADQTVINQTMHRVLFGGEDFDPENVFDPGASRFTAPVAGYYRFETSVTTTWIRPTDPAQRTLLQLKSSREGMTVRGTDAHSVGYEQAMGSGLMRLQAGDTVHVDIYVELPENSTAVPRAVEASPETTFSGSLVAPL